MYIYEVCSENNGNFLISRFWRVQLSIFFIMLVYMPLKYDKDFSCIHCLLCLWQSLRLDVFLWDRRFSFFKKNGSKNSYQISFDVISVNFVYILNIYIKSLFIYVQYFSVKNFHCDTFYPKLKRSLVKVLNFGFSPCGNRNQKLIEIRTDSPSCNREPFGNPPETSHWFGYVPEIKADREPAGLPGPFLAVF